MHATVAELTREALDLSEDQKVTLAHKLLSSIEPAETAENEAAWDSEIQRRISDFRQGLVKTVPADEVFADLDARLK